MKHNGQFLLNFCYLYKQYVFHLWFGTFWLTQNQWYILYLLLYLYLLKSYQVLCRDEWNPDYVHTQSFIVFAIRSLLSFLKERIYHIVWITIIGSFLKSSSPLHFPLTLWNTNKPNYNWLQYLENAFLVCTTISI